MAAYKPRKVYLPLQALDKCSICSSTSSLRLCSACGERIYCSQICQRKDWPTHKATCGSTDRISLKSFYPFLACLVEYFHMCPEKPVHPALVHTIVNSPGGDADPCVFADGSSARLVTLGAPLAHPEVEMTGPKWWPTAASAEARVRLSQRIYREGHALPMALAICIGLLTGMYTTTATPLSQTPGGAAKTRVRLQYGSSPISDFGIVKGVALNIIPQDRLAYHYLVDGAFHHGQDPNDHYWIYFTTVRGETFFLDCALATFNFALAVKSEPYTRKHLAPLLFPAPAFFSDRAVLRDNQLVTKEAQRFSVLRNTDLHGAVEHAGQDYMFSPADANIIWAFMDKIAGRPCTTDEQTVVMVFSMRSGIAINGTLDSREWMAWPTVPTFFYRGEPGGKTNAGMPDDDDKKAWTFITKRARAHGDRKGGITPEARQKAILDWRRMHELTV